jgi:hypothetical protein
MLIEHAPVPVHAPDQPSNALPGEGDGASDTTVPNGNEATHESALQVSPAGLELTLPPPAPPTDAVSAWGPGVTLTVAMPVRPPDVAVIVVLPTATDVTTAVVPFGVTEATAGLLLAHVTVGDASTPVDVLTVAVSCPLWPVAVNVSVLGVSTTEVTVAVPAITVTTAVLLSPPDEAVMIALPNATEVTVTCAPLWLTVAIAGLLVVHVTDGEATTTPFVVTVATSWLDCPSPDSVRVAGEIEMDVVCFWDPGGVVPSPLLLQPVKRHATLSERTKRSRRRRW